MNKEITRDAVRKAGGPVALAEKLGLTKGAVSQWALVPAAHVRRVAAESGVSEHVLRPDIFGPGPATRSRRRAAAGAANA